MKTSDEPGPDGAVGTPGRASIRRGLVTGLSADAVVVGSSLALSVVVARALGPENRGVYFLAILAAMLSAMVGEAGMSTAGVTFAAKRSSDLSQLHALAIAMSALAGTAAGLVLLGAASFWTSTVLRGLEGGLLWLAVAAVAPLVYGQIATAILAGLGQVPILSALRIATALLTLGATVPAVWLSGGSPFWAVAAWLGPTLVFAVALGVTLARRGVRVSKPSRGAVVRILSFAGRGYVGNLSHYGFLRIDVLFISARLGAAAVGIYSLAAVLAERISVIGSALYNASASRIGGAPRDEAAIVAARIFRILLLLLVPGALALGVIAEPLITLVYGSAFEAAALPFVLLLPGTVCLMLWYLLGLYIVASLHRPGITTAIQALALVVSVPLYYFAVLRWGMAGAAIVSSAVYAGLALSGLAVFIRSTGLAPRALVPARDDVVDVLHVVRRRASVSSTAT